MGVKCLKTHHLCPVETVCTAHVNVNVNELHLENSENKLQHVSELTFFVYVSQVLINVLLHVFSGKVSK